MTIIRYECPSCGESHQSEQERCPQNAQGDYICTECAEDLSDRFEVEFVDPDEDPLVVSAQNRAEAFRVAQQKRGETPTAVERVVGDG